MARWQDDSFIRKVLEAHPAKFGRFLKNAESMRFQVLLSDVQHTPSGRPVLVRHGFRTDLEYFYPASSIKICAAVAALQKLARLRCKLPGAPDVTPGTPLTFHPLFPGDPLDSCDRTNQNAGAIALGHEIRKLFLVSDNQAFNRLYAFVGHRTLNESMWALGLKSTRIRHRLAIPMASQDNAYSEPIEVNSSQTEAFSMAPKRSQLAIPSSVHVAGIQVGRAYMDDEGGRVDQPMDFSLKNAITLVDLQDLLVKLLRRDVELGTPPLALDEGLRLLLLEAMEQYPAQSRNPKYSVKDYPDDYCKFFLPGLCRVRPKEALRVYNKIGQAYGFTIDNAYVLDVETGRELFLAMAVYTNANGVLNDDRYEYDAAHSLAADVAEALGRALWQIPPNQSLRPTCLDATPPSLRPSTANESAPTTRDDVSKATCDVSTTGGDVGREKLADRRNGRGGDLGGGKTADDGQSDASARQRGEVEEGWEGGRMRQDVGEGGDHHRREGGLREGGGDGKGGGLEARDPLAMDEIREPSLVRGRMTSSHRIQALPTMGSLEIGPGAEGERSGCFQETGNTAGWEAGGRVSDQGQDGGAGADLGGFKPGPVEQKPPGIHTKTETSHGTVPLGVVDSRLQSPVPRNPLDCYHYFSDE